MVNMAGLGVMSQLQAQPPENTTAPMVNPMDADFLSRLNSLRIITNPETANVGGRGTTGRIVRPSKPATNPYQFATPDPTTMPFNRVPGGNFSPGIDTVSSTEYDPVFNTETKETDYIPHHFLNYLNHPAWMDTGGVNADTSTAGRLRDMAKQAMMAQADSELANPPNDGSMYGYTPTIIGDQAPQVPQQPLEPRKLLFKEEQHPHVVTPAPPVKQVWDMGFGVPNTRGGVDEKSGALAESQADSTMQDINDGMNEPNQVKDKNGNMVDNPKKTRMLQAYKQRAVLLDTFKSNINTATAGIRTKNGAQPFPAGLEADLYNNYINGKYSDYDDFYRRAPAAEKKAAAKELDDFVQKVIDAKTFNLKAGGIGNDVQKNTLISNIHGLKSILFKPH